MSTRDEEIRRMRARHSLATRRDDKYPVTGPWSFRELCEHEHGWVDVGEHWLQCRICWWCKPKLGKPPKLEALPAILKGRVIPPLSGEVNLQSSYCNAGFILDEDRESVLSIVRVRIVQHTYVTEPVEIRRCGIEVKFKDFGWRAAAVIFETAFHRLLSVLAKAELSQAPRAVVSDPKLVREQSELEEALGVKFRHSFVTVMVVCMVASGFLQVVLGTIDNDYNLKSDGKQSLMLAMLFMIFDRTGGKS